MNTTTSITLQPGVTRTIRGGYRYSGNAHQRRVARRWHERNRYVTLVNQGARDIALVPSEQWKLDLPSGTTYVIGPGTQTTFRQSGKRWRKVS